MNAQEAVDAARIHHQWLPDRILFERHGLSPDTVSILRHWGHDVVPHERQGAAQVIIFDRANNLLHAGSDRRVSDGAAIAPQMTNDQ
jgi:gamma-glutamyltranspeptidase/glutathione hydrolase